MTKIGTSKKMDNEFSNQTGCHKLKFLNILNALTPFFLVSWLSTDFTDAHHQYPHMCVCPVCGVCVCGGGGGGRWGGGYSEICIYIGLTIIWGQIFSVRIFAGFQKSEYLWICDFYIYFLFIYLFIFFFGGEGGNS